jgi:hypothetical protein
MQYIGCLFVFIMVLTCEGCNRQFVNACGKSSHFRTHPLCWAIYNHIPSESSHDSDGGNSLMDWSGPDDGGGDGGSECEVTDARIWDSNEVMGQQLWSQIVLSKVGGKS